MRSWRSWDTRQLEVLVVREDRAGSNPVERTMPL